MAQFSTTDMYLAAFMKENCNSSRNEKIGGKIVFTFIFDNDEMAGQLHTLYLQNAKLQAFISNLKELRGKVYQLMKEYPTTKE